MKSIRASRGICPRSFRTGTPGKRSLRHSIRASRRSSSSRARSHRARIGLLAALREQDALGQLAYKVWYYASLHYDQDQRDNTVNASPSARPASDGALAPGDVVVQSRVAADPARDGSRVDGCVVGRSRSTASSSRTCSASRNTSSTRRASGCCRCPAGWAAFRTTPTRRCRRPTHDFRPSRCRPANRSR